jgi:hypothetical protein
MFYNGNSRLWIRLRARRWKATSRVHNCLFGSFLAISLFAAGARGQTTAFTFQGRLNDNGIAANGSYDIQLKLYDTAAPGAGTQIGGTIIFSSVAVANGAFTVQPDFSANAFPGADRFVEVGVRPAGSGGAFTVLSPRQPVTSTPYAIRSASATTADSATNAGHASNSDNAINAANAANATNANNAATATNATQLGGQPASNYVQTADARLSDARAPTAGSSNYIQNTTAQEAANFNISGNGIIAGKLGVGTNAPVSKLDVLGQDAVRLIGFQPFLTLYDSNAANAASRIQTASGDLNLFTESYLDGANTSSFVKLANTGYVGLGSATPNTKLTLIGGSLWNSNGWRASMNLQNATALGWEGNAAGNHFGIGQTDGGLYFFSTKSGFGNTASPANYNMVITDAGDVTQPRDKGGLVKAMAYVNPFNQPAQYVVRGYNSQGRPITMTRSAAGFYSVDFGFDVRDRFISVTSTFSYCIAAATPTGDSNPTAVTVVMNNTTGGSPDTQFFIFVY